MSASRHAMKGHALRAISFKLKIVSAAKKSKSLSVGQLLLLAKTFAANNLTVDTTNVKKFATQAHVPLAVVTQVGCFFAPQVTTKSRNCLEGKERIALSQSQCAKVFANDFYHVVYINALKLATLTIACVVINWLRRSVPVANQY